MKRFLSSLSILLLGMALSAAIILVTAPPRGTEVKLLPTFTPAPLLVDVRGAVRSPGVYALPLNCRVKDAVQAAGGLLSNAASEAVNMAARLKDGEKLTIPVKGAPTPPIPAPTAEEKESPAALPTADPAHPVNINTATLEELDTLPGIGPGIAGRIIAYREANGPFARIEAIQNVSGIGESRFEQIKDRIVVE